MTDQLGTVETHRTCAGSLEDLRSSGRLLTKLGHLPVLVVWHDGRASAIEDRCPHLGFPLHQGTVEAGLLTCHWHHARFDLASGCTLDPWADDARAFDVTIEGEDVWVSARPVADPVGRLRARLQDGLEHQLTLVVAKATLGLLEQPGGADVALRTALEFGLRNRAGGWGSGLTTLVCLANLLDHLEPSTSAAALVHGIRAVANDSAGQPPRFAQRPLDQAGVGPDRLAEWYRRAVETRNTDAAERVVATAVAQGAMAEAEAMMTAAITDHVFIDGGHVLDFTNKAFEALERFGGDLAASVLPSLVDQACRADRAEEGSEWHYPVDLASMVDSAATQLVAIAPAAGSSLRLTHHEIVAVATTVVDGEPQAIVDLLLGELGRGVAAADLGQAVAYAAAIRLARFHTQNDVADWNTLHHAFTTANALHQVLRRQPTVEACRGLLHLALRVHLDRFLSIPAARTPDLPGTTLADLDACWQRQGDVDRAGGIVRNAVLGGTATADVVGALTRAVLAEDAGFHWYQMVEAAARQAAMWPQGSAEAATVLAGAARFLAAHTPTRRELPTMIRTAVRLRRGDQLFDDAAESIASPAAADGVPVPMAAAVPA